MNAFFCWVACLVLVGFTAGCVTSPTADRGSSQTGPAATRALARPAGGSSSGQEPIYMSPTKYQKRSDRELRAELSPLAYAVTQRNATEPPFGNPYWHHHEAGLYVDVVSGEPLFSSLDKFDSGTGWPSFSRPIGSEHVVARVDESLGMERTEVRSRWADSHLGHVFSDGPAPTGLRYCINSAALRFVPLAELRQRGYGEYQARFGKEQVENALRPNPSSQNSCTVRPEGAKAGCQTTLETAILAGGCFWGMEEILRKIPGVLSTEVGYTGGTTPDPTYDQVTTGTTGHAEAVRVVFDPARLSYADLLERWYFRMHDPTTSDRQGHDLGKQYRSAIFVNSPEQRRAALAVKERVASSGRWSRPLVTEIVDAGPFTLAEDYHQRYLERHPGGYTCHYLRE